MPKKPKAKTRNARLRDASISSDQPSDGQNRQFMLLALEQKAGALLDSDDALSKRLADPNEPRTEIQAALAENQIEEAAIIAKHDAIENGVPFTFPAAQELQELRDAMAKLESAIAQTAAIEDLIKATGEVIAAVRQGSG